MATVADILTAARGWIGTPFGHMGRQRGLRCDCIGLIIEVCREVGLVAQAGLPPDWDHLGYGRFPDTYTPSLPLLQYLTPVSRASMQPGDIALFRMTTGMPTHMGFLGDAGHPLSLIHAYAAKTQRQARVQEHRLAGVWLGCLHTVYRLPLAAGEDRGSQAAGRNGGNTTPTLAPDSLTPALPSSLPRGA